MINIKPFLRIFKKELTIGVVGVKFYGKSEKIHFYTRVSCKVEHWDQEEFRIKSQDPSFKDKNTIIQSIVSRINNVYVKYRLKDKVLIPEGFKRTYNRPDDYKTFYEFIKEYQTFCESMEFGFFVFIYGPLTFFYWVQR